MVEDQPLQLITPPKVRKGAELALQQPSRNDKTTARPKLGVQMILMSPAPYFSFPLKPLSVHKIHSNAIQLSDSGHCIVHPWPPFQFFCFKHIGYKLPGYSQLLRLREILQQGEAARAGSKGS